MPVDMKDKILMLLGKLNLPTDLVDKVKEALEKWGEVEVTKVEVSPKEWEEEEKKGITSDDIEKMTPDEAKIAFKKHLEECKMKGESPKMEEKPSIEDKLRKIMY